MPFHLPGSTSSNLEQFAYDFTAFSSTGKIEDISYKVYRTLSLYVQNTDKKRQTQDMTVLKRK